MSENGTPDATGVTRPTEDDSFRIVESLVHVGRNGDGQFGFVIAGTLHPAVAAAMLEHVKAALIGGLQFHRAPSRIVGARAIPPALNERAT